MDKNDKSVRGHIFITGRVQGVAFRYYTQKIANKLGITGWIRNCVDGKVEIIAEGSKERVRQLIDWCHEGPRSAIVKKVDLTWEEYRGEFLFFNVKG